MAGLTLCDYVLTLFLMPVICANLSLWKRLVVLWSEPLKRYRKVSVALPGSVESCLSLFFLSIMVLGKGVSLWLVVGCMLIIAIELVLS